MRPVLLNLDDALTAQTRLRAAVEENEGVVLDQRELGPALRLWSRAPALNRLEVRLAAALPKTLGPVLTFGGSGDFHHVTLLLLRRAIAVAGEPRVTVLHFDNHPDWVRFGPGVHCGSWVARVARLPQVERIVTIGVCSADIDRPERRGADLSIVEDGALDLYAYRAPGFAEELRVADRGWPTVEALGERAFCELLRSRPSGVVYVTIDKDVLRPEDAATNWDQGLLRLDALKAFARAGMAGRRVIGADVFGDWSRPRYGGGMLAAALKAGEAMLDQPWRSPSGHERAANEDVNLDLLALFAEAAA